MIKVLELSASLDGGGVDRLLYDFCTRMHDEFVFEFVVTAKDEGILERKLIQSGYKVYHIEEMSNNLGQYLKTLDRIIADGKYDIVHDHMNQASVGSMIIAKKNHIPVRIAHAHTCLCNETLAKKIRRLIMAYIATKMATDLCACSNMAGSWLWGNKNLNRCFVLKNAINVQNFIYNEKIRGKIREKYGLNDKIVIGHVARLSEEKNQLFILQILERILEKQEDVCLMLVGRGPMEGVLKAEIRRKNLEKNVILLGIRDDVNELLNAMDVFVLPSKYEGFPVTLVEAQANGIPLVISDVITKECVLADNVYRLSLDNSPSIWADEVMKAVGNRRYDVGCVEEYDINNVVKELENYYIELLNQKGKYEQK